MLGLTAYAGMNLMAAPQAGETVVVSAASGGVGQIAGQLAKLKGARVVGITGRRAKCRFVTEELGFDACVSHLSPRLPDELRAACPGGVDVYFENVGGPVFEAVLPLFNPGARMTICGLIAHYGDAEGRDARAALMELGRPIFEARDVAVKTLFVGDFARDHHDEMLAYVAPLVAAGRLKYREDIRQGFEALPRPSPRCCAETTSARCWSSSPRTRRPDPHYRPRSRARRRIRSARSSSEPACSSLVSRSISSWARALCQSGLAAAGEAMRGWRSSSG